MLYILFHALLSKVSSLQSVIPNGRESAQTSSHLAIPRTNNCLGSHLHLLNPDTEPDIELDCNRRSFLEIATQVVPATFAVVSFSQPAIAEGKGKVVVFGGSGYVGSYVGKMLTDKGYQVVSVSRSSASDQKDKVSKILGAPVSMDYVSLDASKDELSSVLKDATAVVSCVGVIGGSNQRAGNGAVNVRIANAAKEAGVGRFVYISVASDLANGPAKFVLGDYIKGKAEAEAAVMKSFGASNSLVIKPAIIAGGPPGEIRPPGPPGVKPVGVEEVAKAVVAGASGAFSGSIDGNSAISAAF